MTYKVQVTRSGKWWAISTPGEKAKIHTQARRLDQVAEVAADALALWYADEDGRSVSASDIEVNVQIGKELDRMLARAKKRNDQAERSRDEARGAIREAVRAAREAGMSVRDVGKLLGVSFQRAAVLTRDTAAAS
ncbi:MAG: hypothetical protein JJE39_10435 [Vicinamibacteria bacterium]|nr:hypothetical protein [Vicinamibacteria bacterium]